MSVLGVVLCRVNTDEPHDIRISLSLLSDELQHSDKKHKERRRFDYLVVTAVAYGSGMRVYNPWNREPRDTRGYPAKYFAVGLRFAGSHCFKPSGRGQQGQVTSLTQESCFFDHINILLFIFVLLMRGDNP